MSAGEETAASASGDADVRAKDARAAATGAGNRGARLATSLSGTNLERAGDYNQRIVLQAIRVAVETTRSELASITGLTTPTIANITRRLFDEGLIVDAGKRTGHRGQPAVRLAINPDGAFAIGLNIDRDHFTVVALDLAGRVRSRASREMAFAMPDQVVEALREELDAIRRSGEIVESRILGIGVALPDELGSVALPHRPAGYEKWNGLDVAALVQEVLRRPVHIDNDAAAAAIGEAQFGRGLNLSSFFYLLISAGLGGGLVIDGSYVRGAGGRSGEIGFLPDPGADVPDRSVQETVSLSALYERLEAAGSPVDSPESLLHLRKEGAETLDRWIEDAARSLLAPLVSVNCLVNPAAVLVGGRLPGPIVDRLVARLTERLAGIAIPARAPVLRAAIADDAPAVGAAILPFIDRLLPSDSILMQSRTAG
jgi:predicted NBD/HSP70 family sugar kinase